jgi:diketogulonate reductase-like aldo/keto reductase
LLPVIGLGTWNMEGDDPHDVVRSVQRAIELGMTHIDTAELYGSGTVEEILSGALAGGVRERVFLASKVLPSNASYAGTIRACEASLRRLKTDRLDLYLLHWPGQHPLGETIRAFEQLKSQGKILRYGVSNFDREELERAVKIAGEGKIACNQVLYHLEERDIEWRLAPWCRSRNIAIVAYSPFGSSKTPWRKTGARKVLEDIAQQHGVTPHAIALAFLVRDPQMFAIPKASKVEHVEANAAGGLILSEREVRLIDEAFPRAPERSSLPTL